MTGEVHAVERHGTISILYVIDERGDEAAVAAEPRMAEAIRQALDYNERPTITYEQWQRLWPPVPFPIAVVR